jgi:hypothetical protein
LAGEVVEIVDAREALAAIPGDLRRVGAGELDADRRYAHGGDARDEARLERRARFPLHGAHAVRLGAHDDEAFQARELPVEGAQQAGAHAADQLAID